VIRAAMADVTTTGGELPAYRVRRVAQYIQDNLQRELRLAELSAVVHMSPYHFARLFKRSTGVPPHRFLVRHRIDEARALLAAQTVPIAEIARSVGFRTPSHFNVGGALVPVMLSLYLFLRSRVRGRMLLGVAVVAAIVHSLARIVPGAGIAVLMFVPPLAAAAVSVVLAFRRAPPVAYVSGSMGALIGADLLNLPRIGELGAPVVSIGGAGTFDGVFLTGIIAGLLA